MPVTEPGNAVTHCPLPFPPQPPLSQIPEPLLIYFSGHLLASQSISLQVPRVPALNLLLALLTNKTKRPTHPPVPFTTGGRGKTNQPGCKYHLWLLSRYLLGSWYFWLRLSSESFPGASGQGRLARGPARSSGGPARSSGGWVPLAPGPARSSGSVPPESGD